jgi:hypothetical protein
MLIDNPALADAFSTRCILVFVLGLVLPFVYSWFLDRWHDEY